MHGKLMTLYKAVLWGAILFCPNAHAARAVMEHTAALNTTIFVDTITIRIGISTAAPQTSLDVNGNAQFGSGGTKSTFTTTGVLNMAPGAAINASSVNASGFFGNGSGLTNVVVSPLAALTNVDNKFSVGQSITGQETVSSTITIQGQDANGYSLLTSSSIKLGTNACLLWGDGTQQCSQTPAGTVTLGANNTFTGNNTFTLGLKLSDNSVITSTAQFQSDRVCNYNVTGTVTNGPNFAYQTAVATLTFTTRNDRGVDVCFIGSELETGSNGFAGWNFLVDGTFVDSLTTSKGVLREDTFTASGEYVNISGCYHLINGDISATSHKFGFIPGGASGNTSQIGAAGSFGQFCVETHWSN